MQNLRICGTIYSVFEVRYKNMAFDAGMLACVTLEILAESGGARVEKIYQPDRDEIHIQIRSLHGGKRILINAGSNNPRIGFTEISKENPQNPPMFCVLLRKRLQGAKLADIAQLGFERAVMLSFDTRDEMGFDTRCYLVAELMGKYSNLMLLDNEKRIISALKTVDFTTSSLRQVLPGMLYELPPKQNKADPLSATQEDFFRLYEDAPHGGRADKFILSSFAGISSAVAREMVYRACGDTDAQLSECTRERLYSSFCEIIGQILNSSYTPSAVFEGDRAVEYAFCRLTHYDGLTLREYESPSAMIDSYFESRDREVRVKQRATDILKILTNSESRLLKKMEKQRAELADCALGEQYKRNGDLITSNIHKIARGDRYVELVDYNDYNEADGSFGTVRIELDKRLSPSANAQRMYKKYNKCKNAERELTIQLQKAQQELDYVYSVFDALAHAENASDLVEIRDELYNCGYASKMKNYSPQKKKSTAYMKFKTSDGYVVLCGKNNIQNEHITFDLAHKSDYWFHIKNKAGSHVVMLCNGEEPDSINFTEAAEIAAYYSSAQGGSNLAVDYTFAKNVKKIQGANPGLVIYHTNWTAYVTPSAEKIAKLRII